MIVKVFIVVIALAMLFNSAVDLVTVRSQNKVNDGVTKQFLLVDERQDGLVRQGNDLTKQGNQLVEEWKTQDLDQAFYTGWEEVAFWSLVYEKLSVIIKLTESDQMTYSEADERIAELVAFDKELTFIWLNLTQGDLTWDYFEFTLKQRLYEAMTRAFGDVMEEPLN